MFTGIVASIGSITSVQPFGDGYRLRIDAGTLDLSDVILGITYCDPRCLYDRSRTGCQK
jgi:riboflavin synthase alpha subunit